MTNLEPGAELDAAVATALGWRKVRISENNSEAVCGIPPDVPLYESALQVENWRFIPPYSTSPGDAIAALEEFRRTPGYEANIRAWSNGEYRVCIKDIKTLQRVEAETDTLPHAICLAILKAHEKLKGAES